MARRKLTDPAALRGRASRNKGHAYERHLAGRFREVFETAKRGIGQARSGGEVADVEVPFLWVEAKKHQRVQILAALEQAIAASGASSGAYRIPLVVSREDRGREIVTLTLEDFLAIVEGWVKGKAP